MSRFKQYTVAFRNLGAARKPLCARRKPGKDISDRLAEQFPTLKPPGGELHAGRQRRLNCKHWTTAQHSKGSPLLTSASPVAVRHSSLPCFILRWLRATGGADAVPAGAEAGWPVPGGAAGRREPPGAHLLGPQHYTLVRHTLPLLPRIGCTWCALRISAWYCT
jgi:hypothetical protein